MMRTMKLYEQPELIVLAFEEDIVTTSNVPSGDVPGFDDKGVEDFLGA